MKKIINTLLAMALATILSFSVKAQNLVPNPSFEIYDTCPSALSQISRATGWIQVRPSPDYYNTCDTLYPEVEIPHNYFGYQYPPYGGSAYAGFCGKDGYFEVREYLGAQLITPLQIGNKYYVSIEVCLAGTYSGCGINKVGALFSTIQYSDTNMAPTCNCAQVYANSIITDTTNWTLIKGSFLADSSYSFISLGNFFVDSLTDSTQIEGSECVAYYYIDNICVSTDSSYCADYTNTGINNLQPEDSFRIYPNPTVDFLYINVKTSCKEVFKLYDIYGHILRIQESNHAQCYTLNLSDFPSGAYILTISGYLMVSNYIVIKL